jgi:hypothetical protein
MHKSQKDRFHVKIISNLKHPHLEKPTHKLTRSELGLGAIGLVDTAITTFP